MLTLALMTLILASMALIVQAGRKPFDEGHHTLILDSEEATVSDLKEKIEATSTVQRLEDEAKVVAASDNADQSEDESAPTNRARRPDLENNMQSSNVVNDIANEPSKCYNHSHQSSSLQDRTLAASYQDYSDSASAFVQEEEEVALLNTPVCGDSKCKADIGVIGNCQWECSVKSGRVSKSFYESLADDSASTEPGNDGHIRYSFPEYKNWAELRMFVDRKLPSDFGKGAPGKGSCKLKTKAVGCGFRNDERVGAPCRYVDNCHERDIADFPFWGWKKRTVPPPIDSCRFCKMQLYKAERFEALSSRPHLMCAQISNMALATGKDLTSPSEYMSGNDEMMSADEIPPGLKERLINPKNIDGNASACMVAQPVGPLKTCKAYTEAGGDGGTPAGLFCVDLAKRVCRQKSGVKCWGCACVDTRDIDEDHRLRPIQKKKTLPFQRNQDPTLPEEVITWDTKKELEDQLAVLKVMDHVFGKGKWGVEGENRMVTIVQPSWDLKKENCFPWENMVDGVCQPVD
eukprot:gnl/MRDRNA2_/MRDRNA2_67308_c0_seq1.p1 gnl/MRDRNA2_/MRDRNA2_67308_c0~~gnl/MRDRNA2_/MRDRNA2_67308_c0_seq1.p1  ORF type:complete len:519 (-),score=92.20 gnl/MRDRNA2_/MRDRNA2_67308_c0_seq1:62-1618(-)